MVSISVIRPWEGYVPQTVPYTISKGKRIEIARLIHFTNVLQPLQAAHSKRFIYCVYPTWVAVVEDTCRRPIRAIGVPVIMIVAYLIKLTKPVDGEYDSFIYDPAKKTRCN